MQFHPEYLSRVLSPSKPYLGFVAASARMLDEVTEALKLEKVDVGFGGLAINGDGESHKAAF